MKHLPTFEQFITESIRPDQIESIAKDIAYSMPNHTKYEDMPTDDQILKAFKYFPDLKYVKNKKDQQTIVDKVKEILGENK